MKLYIYILVIGLMLSDCTNSEETGITVSVLEDVTETDFIARPNATVLGTKYGLNTHPWRSATFRYGAISSLVHNRRSQLSLKGGTALFGNQLERDAEIEQFYADMNTILSEPRDSIEHQFSSIWKPIVEELLVLQKDTLNQITLCVFSDLQENSEWFSVHRYKDLLLLKYSRESLEELYLEHASSIIKNPSNINVVVVYQPHTMKQDKTFAMVRELYTKVFHKLGIPIEFTSHLN